MQAAKKPFYKNRSLFGRIFLDCIGNRTASPLYLRLSHSLSAMSHLGDLSSWFANLARSIPGF